MNLQSTDYTNQASHEGYIPGTCNLGKQEVARRRKLAIMGLVFTLCTIASMQLMHMPHLFRLCLFFPLMMTSLGFFQTYFKFCVAFGLTGVFKFSDSGSPISVDQEKYLKLDKQKAIRIITTSIIVSITLAVVYTILPV